MAVLYPRGITFDQVWAAIMELKESQAETDGQMKETDRRLEKKLSELGDRFGEMVEYMVMPNLLVKFKELGFIFTRANPRSVFRDKNLNVIAEVDIFLENGDKVMIVEVKSKPTSADVRNHIKRMGIIRTHADLHNDKRKYFGTIAGMIMGGNVKQFAFKNGFYVAEPSGETFNIIVPGGGYAPKEW